MSAPERGSATASPSLPTSSSRPGREVIGSPRPKGLGTLEEPDYPGEVDLAVHVVSGPPDGSGEVAACLARGDRAIETELPAGTSYLVVDTLMDLAGDFDRPSAPHRR